MFDSPGYGDLYFVNIKRFLYVVEGTFSKSFDRTVKGLVAADHHDNRVRRRRTYEVDQVDSAHAAHVNVADNKIEGIFLKVCDRLLSRGCLGAIVLFTEDRKEQASDGRFVVDDKNPGLWDGS